MNLTYDLSYCNSSFSRKNYIYILSLNLHQGVLKSFSKSCLQWELNLQQWPSLDLRLNAYPNGSERHVLLGRPLTEVCFMHHFTFWIWIIIESLKHVLCKFYLKMWNLILSSVEEIWAFCARGGKGVGGHAHAQVWHHFLCKHNKCCHTCACGAPHPSLPPAPPGAEHSYFLYCHWCIAVYIWIA